jgi:hypothetical protein
MFNFYFSVMERKFLYVPVNPSFQIVFIIFNLLCLFVFFLLFHNSFFSNEYWPKDTHNKEDINLVSHKGCKISFFVKDIIESDIKSGKNIIGAKLLFEVGKKDSDKIDIKKLKDSIIFKNGKILDSRAYVAIEGEEANIYCIYYMLEVYSVFKYNYFPFDDHVLRIKFEIPEKSLNFNLNANCIINEKSDFSGWYPVKSSSEIVKDNAAKSNKVSFYLALNKHGYRVALSIILPMFIIFFVNLFSLSVDLKAGRRLIITSLLSLNAFRFVLESIAPKTSYIQALDKFYIAFLIISTVIFVIHILKDEMLSLSYWIIGLSHIAVVLNFFYILMPWVKVYFGFQ